MHRLGMMGAEEEETTGRGGLRERERDSDLIDLRERERDEGAKTIGPREKKEGKFSPPPTAVELKIFFDVPKMITASTHSSNNERRLTVVLVSPRTHLKCPMK